MIGAMFSQNIPSQVDKDGCYFIDRNGKIFEYVLQFLRSGEFIPPDNPNKFKLLKCEAEFFQIIPLLDRLIAHEKNILKYHQTKTICISNISSSYYSTYKFEMELHCITKYQNFIFQSVNNNTFKMIHQQEDVENVIVDVEDGYIHNVDIDNKDFVKSIIDDAWTLYEKRLVSSYNELISFLILNSFEWTAIDSIKKALSSSSGFWRDGKERLVILCYVKPDDNTPIIYHV